MLRPLIGRLDILVAHANANRGYVPQVTSDRTQTIVPFYPAGAISALGFVAASGRRRSQSQWILLLKSASSAHLQKTKFALLLHASEGHRSMVREILIHIREVSCLLVVCKFVLLPSCAM